MTSTRKVVIVAAIAAAATIGIGLTLSLSPRVAFANSAPFWMNAPHGQGFGAWQTGQRPMNWQGWQSGYTMGGNGTKENWTGSLSIRSLQSIAIDSIKGKVKTDVVNAASAAEKTLGNESKIGAISLAPINGYLVYQAYGIDDSNNVHRIIIDVVSGNVLDNTKIDMASGIGPWFGRGSH